MPQRNVTTSGSHLAKALVTPTGGSVDTTLADVAQAAIAVASTSAPGRVELATGNETAAATDSTRAVTPAGLAAQAFIKSTDVTYKALNDNGDVGTGSSQLARGNHRHADVTPTAAGFMSAADKAKLDGVEAGATSDQTGAEIVAAIDTELGSTQWQQSGDGGSADLNIPGLPKKLAASGADLVAIWDAEAAAHRHVPVAGLPAGRGIVAPAGDDPAISLELPAAVNRRDFLLGFTATGAVTTTKVATAALMDSLAATGVRSVPHLAALRTTNPPPGEAAVWLSGHSEPRDGGEGMFHWDPASVLADNGGTVVAPDLKSAGRWIRAAQGDRIDVRWFGAKGDGVTDNSDALIRMRNYCRQDRSKLYEIYFPPGHYTYEKNTFLASIGNVVVSGYGAKWQCISGSPVHEFSRVLHTGSMFVDAVNLDPLQRIGYANGMTFASVSRGSYTIQLLSPPATSDLFVGAPVLIHGFSQQTWSYPPNLRHFQFNKIAAIDSVSGLITLEDPLSESYNQNWPSYDLTGADGIPRGYGAPRILSLHREGKFIINPYMEIRGVEFMNNPQGAAGNGLTLDGDVVILKDIFHHFRDTPSCNRERICIGGTFLGGSEPDKLIDRMVYEDTTFYGNAGGIDGGTGVNRAEFRRCKILDTTIGLSPRELIIEDTIFKPDVGTQYGVVGLSYDQWQVSYLKFQNNKIYHDGNLLFAINNYLVRTVSLTALNNDLRASAAGHFFDDHLIKLAPGTLLWNEDMSMCERITEIDYDQGTSEWVFKGNWNLTNGLYSLYYTQFQKIEEDGTIFFGGTKKKFREPRVTQGIGINDGRIVLDSIQSGILYYELFGYLEKILIIAGKPYTGADRDPRIAVDVGYVTGGSAVRVAYASLAQPLIIRIDDTGATCNRTLFNAAALDIEVPVKFLRIYAVEGVTPLSGSHQELPRIMLHLNVSPVNG